MWNAIDDRPDFCDTFRAQDPDARMWRGSELPLVQQDQSLRHLCFLNGSQHSLICNLRGSLAAARANFLLRVVKPEATTPYGQQKHQTPCFSRKVAVTAGRGVGRGGEEGILAWIE